uniref:Uncharacterized protein n=1 Tax=Rousettus aegyptiacus TaxID=9407 RepID=A0A7J8BEZ8_ROUAE|nr:hypothetical protein HJG63_009738 [Rousettus aegyptiacus]
MPLLVYINSVFLCLLLMGLDYSGYSLFREQLIFSRSRLRKSYLNTCSFQACQVIGASSIPCPSHSKPTSLPTIFLQLPAMVFWNIQQIDKIFHFLFFLPSFLPSFFLSFLSFLSFILFIFPTVSFYQYPLDRIAIHLIIIQSLAFTILINKCPFLFC